MWVSFDFELQYLNLLDNFISDQIGLAESQQAKTDLGSMLHFDYARSILLRHDNHIQSLLSWLDKGLKEWNKSACVGHAHSEDVPAVLWADLAYLSGRIQSLIALCETGRSTLKSQASTVDSR